jgi:nucleoside-diphosphate-sugar epimerase
MRLIIVGYDSYIAGHVQHAAVSAGIEVLPLPFDAAVSDVVRPTDTVFNFAVNPAYKSEPYNEEFDCDLRVARIAARAGARSAIVSSRKVYPENARWNAVEDGPCGGDGSFYGQNKAQTEKRVRAVPGMRLTVFRLSNICGYEYSPGQVRRTFFGLMQASLKAQSVIRFDMHPDTRRDFLPVEHCARALIVALKADVEGTYNLGAGFPVRCGQVAAWIEEGFEGGTLIVDPPVIRDEFFLNMDKWGSKFGSMPTTPDELRDCCVKIGRRLKCEEF